MSIGILLDILLDAIMITIHNTPTNSWRRLLKSLGLRLLIAVVGLQTSSSFVIV